MATSSYQLQDVFDLNGRVALVTGGGTGIGWMIAEGLATNGAKVYITGRRKEVLEKTAAAFNQGARQGSVIPLVMDVADRDSISQAQEKIKSAEGRLHILVNNAGQEGPVSPFFNQQDTPEHASAETLGRALFESESFESWAQIYTVNSASIFFVTTAFLGLLAKGSEDRPGYTSCVINNSSISAHIKLSQNHFAYNSSKAAVAHLTKMMATEFALQKIPVRVCGIAPGVYVSEMTASRLPKNARAKEVNELGHAIVSVPAERPGTGPEIAGTVMYLVSPAGCYTNGQEIVVDGGYIAVNPATV